MTQNFDYHPSDSDFFPVRNPCYCLGYYVRDGYI